MGFLSHVRHLNTARQFAARRPLSKSTSPLQHFRSNLAPFSSTSLVLGSSKTKLGLGGNNWSRMEPAQYKSVVQTGLEQGITVIEAGQEGGDKAVVDAMLDQPTEGPITVTFRVGYHTFLPVGGEEQTAHQKFAGDVAVEQHPFLGPQQTREPLDNEEISPKPPQEADEDSPVIQILHNISKSFIQHELKESPLVQYQKDNSDLKVVALLHNPEAQIMTMANEQDINQVYIEERQSFLREKLVEAFSAMEQAVADRTISSYGVVSNGLCLPPEHPLALSPETVLEAAKLAMGKSNSSTCHFSVLQLPINLMERTGLQVARDLREKIETDDQYQYLRDLQIYAMRPLTCYPDRGTGTGHAFRLVDYLLPGGPKPPEEGEDETSESTEEEKPISDEELASKQWSNHMQGPPLIYNIALRKAMSHFDAEFILEEKLKRELSAEERETLDGCKLLQSMLHDLDHGLVDVRSLGAHEQDLYQRIIPLIHDTFEGYDEETANVLEIFFKSYSLAVRYSIAHNTRVLLQQGGDDGKGFKYEEIPDDEKLQDYALKYLLKEKAIDQVIVGATKPEQVKDMVRTCRKFDAESEEEVG